MKSGLKVMAAVDAAATAANLFGLPVSGVPKEWKAKAQSAVGDLSKESSVAEFDVLQQSVTRLDADGAGDASTQKKEDDVKAIRGSALRDFEQFLSEKDADRTFSGLNRMVTPEGSAFWTLLNQTQIEEKEKALAQKEAAARGEELQRDAYVQPEIGSVPSSPLAAPAAAPNGDEDQEMDDPQALKAEIQRLKEQLSQQASLQTTQQGQLEMAVGGSWSKGYYGK